MTLEEAKRVITDRSHPAHQRYRQGDPEIVSQVDLAFQREFPGELRVDGDARLERLLNGEKV